MSGRLLGDAEVANSKNLTLREEQIAELVALERSNKVIAAELGISEETVKNHLYRIFRRLGVETRVGVAVWYSGQHQRRETGSDGDIVLVCQGGCGIASDGVTSAEFWQGKVEQVEGSLVPQWTCGSCVAGKNNRAE